MLHFLRRIRRSLISTGATRKYLLYAVGEILLVMIGILLALQVNNWNEERKLRAIEIEILVDIVSDLDNDTSVIRVNLESLNSSISSMKVILNQIERDLSYHDSLDLVFSQTFWHVNFSPIQSAYDALKSKGLEVITNRELRNRIQKIYEHIYKEDQAVGLVVKQNMDEYLLEAKKHFKIFNPFDGMAPLDFGRMKNSNSFTFALSTALVVQIFQFSRIEQTLDEVLNLIESINSELNKS